MKRQTLLIVLAIFVLTSCNHYESEVPITNSDNSIIDSDLLGQWYLSSDNKEDDTSGFLEVIPFNKTEYLVQLKEFVDSSEHIESIVNMRMFSSKIKKDTYLNLQFIGSDDDNKFLIYRFKSISGNRYKLYFLSKEKFTKKFTNPKSFESYIEQNSKEFEKSFEVEGILKRKIK
ncbi:hypothetical protein L3049_21385 [Labilibaculum sp. DW002]|uniref:Lipocalin-like domain-containing protein n=1 Tax=Paralabilibaculum antarcticum TaxID=2912572 RepID=A0ABT5W142_9BACT|nr:MULTISPECIES: hypothetical protein [unclassified Labilibaculum]MBI9060220.1 hypothetical protein [Labilibaculum sp.]MDE5420553.1 hypothetical protein [Labilibaculum sp. DW002]